MFLTKKKYNNLVDEIVRRLVKKIDSTQDTSSLTEVFETKSVSLDDDKKRIAYALNLCTVSVSQIIDYDDIYILEQEYDAILNNLNLQNFEKHESLLRVLKQILDVITFFKIQEGDKKLMEKNYQHRMKNAIWSAVPNLSIIFSGGNPLTMALSVATQIGTGYMNYRRAKSQIILEKEEQSWKLQQTAMEQFNGLRRELFETAWRLSDAYKFDDKYRLTEKQITRYNAILLDPDALRRFERLDVISDTFRAFPPFWYYKATAAKEIYHKYQIENPGTSETYKQKALDAYQEFENIYVKFMREDVIAASCTIDHISLLDMVKDREKIKKLLTQTIDLAGDNFDVLQICILIYLGLNEIQEAKLIIRKLVNEDYNIGLNGLLLSRIYCKHDKNRAEYDILEKRIGKNNVMPWFDDDDESAKNYITYRKKDAMWRFNEFLVDITLKHQRALNNSLHCNYVKPKDKIEWFLKNIDIIELLVNTLNNYFKELVDVGIFIQHDGENTKGWDEYFQEQISNISRKIKTFASDYTEVKKFIKRDKDLVLKGMKFAFEKSLRIDQIIYKCDLKNFVLEFKNDLFKKYNDNFSVKSAESADQIIVLLDKWYNANNIVIPIMSNIENESIIKRTQKQENVYFDYNDFIEDEE
jgi:hypothetical protein